MLSLAGELLALLDLPGPGSAGDLVHVTLFRYAMPLRNPAALLRWLSAAEFCVEVEVSELLVIRERVFPSLDYEILHRVGLPSPRRCP